MLCITTSQWLRTQGLCRTGKDLCCDWENVKPDLVILGKVCTLTIPINKVVVEYTLQVACHIHDAHEYLYVLYYVYIYRRILLILCL
jgi:hypothetical protein